MEPNLGILHTLKVFGLSLEGDTVTDKKAANGMATALEAHAILKGTCDRYSGEERKKACTRSHKSVEGKQAALFALRKWGLQSGMRFNAAGSLVDQQLVRSGSSNKQNTQGEDLKAPLILRVERLPEPPASGSRYAPMEFSVPKYSVHLHWAAPERRHQDGDGDDQMQEQQDGQPLVKEPVCEFTELANFEVEDYEQHFFWPSKDLLIRVEPDSTDDKGKVVAVLKHVTFFAQPDALSGVPAEEAKLVTDAASTLNGTQLREQAGWLTASLRTRFDQHMPEMLRGEVSVEQAKGQVFVVRSQQPSAWSARLKAILKQQLTFAGQVDGHGKGVMFKCDIEFEWREALAAEKEAQARRLGDKIQYEEEIFGRKIHMRGNFRMTDDPNKLAAMINAKGAEMKELTAEIWTTAAVAKVEIASTGKGDAKAVGAFVVMNSKAEAELLIHMITRHQMLTWGGKAISAFICRKWKSKEQRTQRPKGAPKATRSATAGSSKTINSGSTIAIGAATESGTANFQDRTGFPSLPSTAHWGAVKNTQQHQKAATTAAAAPRTTAPPTPSHHTPPHDKLSELAAQVRALTTAGEEARSKTKEMEKQVQSLGGQLEGLTTIVSELALEVATQQRSNSAWQDSMTRQMTDMTLLLRRLSATNQGQIPPTPVTLSPRTDAKKRAWTDTQLCHGAGTAKSQPHGEDEADNMETADDGSLASVSEQPSLSNGQLKDGQPSAAQKGGGSPHPQPQKEVEGGDH
jgi:hypothetical protein